MFPEILSVVAHLVSPNTHYVGLADCSQQGTHFFFFTFVMFTLASLSAALIMLKLKEVFGSETGNAKR
jgi:hypothetical protein